MFGSNLLSEHGPAGPVLTYATWNPADKDASVVLSNGNLTAGGTWSVRGNQALTGKVYFELNVDTVAASLMIGVGTSAAALNNWMGWADAFSWGYKTDGMKWHNTISAAFGAAYTTGDVVSVAYDSATGDLWWAKNGTWQASGNPATGVNPAYTTAGTVYPMVQLTNATITANFGASAFAYTVPTGFIGVYV